jgi:hypothetical protein
MTIINFVLDGFNHAGAHHASMLVVSHTLGWVETHTWLVKICRLGTKGCHL